MKYINLIYKNSDIKIMKNQKYLICIRLIFNIFYSIIFYVIYSIEL